MRRTSNRSLDNFLLLIGPHTNNRKHNLFSDRFLLPPRIAVDYIVFA